MQKSKSSINESSSTPGSYDERGTLTNSGNEDTPIRILSQEPHADQKLLVLGRNNNFF
jgi:hypothetical protein